MCDAVEAEQQQEFVELAVAEVRTSLFEYLKIFRRTVKRRSLTGELLK
jgi:hypothetical protein